MAMDFFAHQDEARKKTRVMVCLYALSVVCISACVALVVALIFPSALFSQGNYPVTQAEVNAQLLRNGSILAGFVGAVIMGVSLVKMVALQFGGGKSVAQNLGGRLVSHSTVDPKERQLINVAQEMALAAGIPTPELYVLDQEQGLNAFAAGTTPQKAVVAVTRGLLETLSRDELQGVIAHEYSHIFFGDMKLNIRLMGTLFGILFLFQLGEGLVRPRYHSRNSDSKEVLLGAGLIAIGLIGYLFASIMKAYISRQREFLADAASVQYTRNPGGIAGALEKIATGGSSLEASKAGEASHLFFALPLKSFLGGLMATHPPIGERISRIGNTGQAKLKQTSRESPSPQKTSFDYEVANHPEIASLAGTATGGRIPSSAVTTHTAEPTPQALKLASSFLVKMPTQVKKALEDPYSARALCLCMLISDDQGHASKQISRLRLVADPEVMQMAEALYPVVVKLGRQARLPILDLAIPPLLQLSKPQCVQFKKAIEAAIHADGKVDLFEFGLSILLDKHLFAHILGRRPSPSMGTSKAVKLVLSTLALEGHPNSRAEALAAYNRAAPTVAILPAGHISQLGGWQPDPLRAALHRLDHLSFRGKKQLLHACGLVASHDGLLHEREYDLIRIVSDYLGCPLGAFVA